MEQKNKDSYYKKDKNSVLTKFFSQRQTLLLLRKVGI